MRVWDVPPEVLCHKHLLGEHRELHGLWNILVHDKKGYSRHPETRRWVGKLKALYLRHELLVAEMERRGYQHNSPLDRSHASGGEIQDELIDSIERQYELLAQKDCDCILAPRHK